MWITSWIHWVLASLRQPCPVQTLPQHLLIRKNIPLIEHHYITYKNKRLWSSSGMMKLDGVRAMQFVHIHLQKQFYSGVINMAFKYVQKAFYQPAKCEFAIASLNKQYNSRLLRDCRRFISHGGPTPLIFDLNIGSKQELLNAGFRRRCNFEPSKYAL